MTRVHVHQVIPGALITAAMTISLATTVKILVRASHSLVTTPRLAPPMGPAPAEPPLEAGPVPVAPPSGPGPGQALEPATTRTYTGPVEVIRTGAVQVAISVAGGRITAVAIVAPAGNPRSAAINARAIPLLQSETLQAQSAAIALVSGATATSTAYEQSLQAALDQATPS